MPPVCSEIVTETERVQKLPQHFNRTVLSEIIFKIACVLYDLLLSFFLINDSWPTRKKKGRSSTAGSLNSFVMTEPRLSSYQPDRSLPSYTSYTKVQPFAVLKTHPVFAHLLILFMFVPSLRIASLFT